MKYFVYILRCNDGSLYTGITNDIKKRMKAHKEGTGSKYVRARLPFEVVFTENHKDRSSASKREYEIKQLTKRGNLKLIG